MAPACRAADGNAKDSHGCRARLSRAGWNAGGMHHVDPLPLADGRWLAAVDGWRMDDEADAPERCAAQSREKSVIRAGSPCSGSAGISVSSRMILSPTLRNKSRYVSIR